MRPLASAFLLLLAAAGLALAAGSYRVAAQSSGETSAEIADDLASLRQMALSDDAALLDRMIGQMIMVGFLGHDERDQGVAAVRDQLAQGVIGGVVLYPENIRSARQLRNLTALLLNAKSELVPLIAVDQEGASCSGSHGGTAMSIFRRRGTWEEIPSSGPRTARSASMAAWPRSSPAPASTSISAPWLTSTPIRRTRSSAGGSGASAPIQRR